MLHLEQIHVIVQISNLEGHHLISDYFIAYTFIVVIVVIAVIIKVVRHDLGSVSHFGRFFNSDLFDCYHYSSLIS